MPIARRRAGHRAKLVATHRTRGDVGCRTSMSRTIPVSRSWRDCCGRSTAPESTARTDGCSYQLPRLEVAGAGLIPFPVPEVQAQALIAAAERGAIRQGDGHRAGSFGARLLAGRRGQRGCRRRCVERHAGADRRSRRRRARLPARAHRGAALQVAGVRAGRILQSPPRQREGDRHGRHAGDLAAGRRHRRRPGSPPPATGRR